MYSHIKNPIDLFSEYKSPDSFHKRILLSRTNSATLTCSGRNCRFSGTFSSADTSSTAFRLLRSVFLRCENAALTSIAKCGKDFASNGFLRHGVRRMTLELTLGGG